MSWIDKELRRRHRAALRDSQLPTKTGAATLNGEDRSRVGELWRQLVAANGALPSPLQLQHQRDAAAPAVRPSGNPSFGEWLRAPNGAGLGLADDAIRYEWPVRSHRTSFNFWLRWEPLRGWRIRHRVGRPGPLSWMADHALRAGAIELIIRALVTGRRVKVRQIRKKRLGLF